MIAQDFLLDNQTGDLATAYGDFVVGWSDQQNIADILIAFPGWWKEFPQMGVGIQGYLGSSGQEQQLLRSIRVQLTNDGFTCNPRVSINPNGTITTAPNAIRNTF